MLRYRLVIVTILMSCAAGQLTWAAGSSSSGNAGVLPTTPAQSPEQQAQRALKQGIRHRDRALKYEQKAADASSDKRRDKALKRVVKEWQKAIAKQRDALRHDPRSYQAASELGYALRKTGEFNKALGAYNYALEINPDFHQAVEYRAEALLALGQYKAVQEAYMALFRNDRPLADQLMLAMDRWLVDSRVAELSDPEASFASWVEQRQKMAAMTQSLSSHPSRAW